jgi:hypothetical protein
MPALSTWTPEDGVLGAVAPLALAAAAGTALVVDLDPNGPAYPGAAGLAELVAEGPTRRDLEPALRGVAVLRNGGVEPEDAEEVLGALVVGWPAVVFRLPPHRRPDRTGVVPVRPLVPGGLFPAGDRPAVYQSAGWRITAPGPGIVLPRPPSAVVKALLEGARPRPNRWIRSWQQVWELPWE